MRSPERIQIIKKAIKEFEGKEHILPEWISQDKSIKDKEIINKVFKSFGLKDFRKDVELDLDEDTIRNQFIPLCLPVFESLQIIFEDIYEKAKFKAEDLVFNSPEKVNEIYEIKKIASVALQLYGIVDIKYRLDERLKSIISIENGKASIILPLDISSEGKNVFRKGEKLFRVYGKLKDMAVKHEIGFIPPSIDQIPSVKLFNSKNIPLSKKMSIVFSSCAWDIATMSERGISSCQRWDFDGSEKYRLIGSILSKYVGIIYLTLGTQIPDRGEKMIKRCVVRFGVDQESKKPVIIVDKMYDSYMSEIARLFVSSLQEKTGLNVLDFSGGGTKSSGGIPHSRIKLPYEDIYERDKSYKDIPFPEYAKKNNTAQDQAFEIIFDFFNNFLDNILYSKRYELAEIVYGNDKNKHIESFLSNLYFLRGTVMKTISAFDFHPPPFNSKIMLRKIIFKIIQKLSSPIPTLATIDRNAWKVIADYTVEKLKDLDTKDLINKLDSIQRDI